MIKPKQTSHRNMTDRRFQPGNHCTIRVACFKIRPKMHVFFPVCWSQKSKQKQNKCHNIKVSNVSRFQLRTFAYAAEKCSRFCKDSRCFCLSSDAKLCAHSTLEWMCAVSEPAIHEFPLRNFFQWLLRCSQQKLLHLPKHAQRKNVFKGCGRQWRPFGESTVDLFYLCRWHRLCQLHLCRPQETWLSSYLARMRCKWEQHVEQRLTGCKKMTRPEWWWQNSVWRCGKAEVMKRIERQPEHAEVQTDSVVLLI